MIAPVSALPSAAQPQSPSTSAGTPTVDYDTFLQLLVTQLKNQDPLSPMEDTEYVAQLATFSNVEQNILTNRHLESLTTLATLGDAGGLIGRTMTPANGDAGTVREVKISSEGAFAVLDDGREVPLGAGLSIS